MPGKLAWGLSSEKMCRIMEALTSLAPVFAFCSHEETVVSGSDYVRMVTVAQARREVASAADQTILLSPDEQLAFWQALQTSAKLTPA